KERLLYVPWETGLQSILARRSRLGSLGTIPRRTEVAQRLVPTGECWCGCGEEAAIGSFFRPGHDKVAESAVVAIHYGGVAQLLVEHGYGPGGKNARQSLEAWRAAGGRVR